MCSLSQRKSQGFRFRCVGFRQEGDRESREPPLCSVRYERRSLAENEERSAEGAEAVVRGKSGDGLLLWPWRVAGRGVGLGGVQDPPEH